jgi:SAM-dependent methyltransferase
VREEESFMRPCPNCEASKPRPTPYGRGEWSVVGCAECGFVYLSDAPDYAVLQDEHEWTKSAKEERARRVRERPILSSTWLPRMRKRLFGRRMPMDYVERHVGGGSLLDLGCGDGKQLVGHGERYRLHGIEISPILAQRAEAVFAPSGGRVVCGDVLGGLRQFERGSMDAAVLRSYLEHELHPKEVLQALRDVLKPGAIAVVKVPNFGSLNRRIMGRNWCGFRFPDHVNYFTPASLAAMARSAGFQIRSGVLERLPTSDNMWAVLTRPARV